MRYTVVWSKKAQDRHAGLWTSTANRRAVTVAANEIDRLLGDDADQKGESRQAGERVLLVSPLGVLFRAIPADRIANVVWVWEFSAHGHP